MYVLAHFNFNLILLYFIIGGWDRKYARLISTKAGCRVAMLYVAANKGNSMNTEEIPMPKIYIHFLDNALNITFAEAVIPAE